eukprot:CAMPEP_0198735562 /NCGR_PEP_ID=MMETSP1475-20131203/60464_1 /TAXON_ID= ORGANISM="Unidentified sp., Strain CCMP1999" /NCGR_SAMPLE_ID=MMETSP1475 /ASSEMBLY_ACC=CAM_ASM_001111 /LENGTH=32 /DNA_ID= /DNA_START= /DNA_END= /DNA_ORIENTATION=
MSEAVSKAEDARRGICLGGMKSIASGRQPAIL